VSCHYLVDGAGHITQMAGEEMRWRRPIPAGQTDINRVASGPNRDHNGIGPDRQMDAVINCRAT
jgi:N-acetyl-anhydromuramyl-L-alanine amidase AmpD